MKIENGILYASPTGKVYKIVKKTNIPELIKEGLVLQCLNDLSIITLSYDFIREKFSEIEDIEIKKQTQLKTKYK